MGFDNECIQNIQSLKGEYFCPVCRLLVYPNEALQSQCSHLYCKPCLKYIVGTTQACPYDGYLVTEADSKPLLQSNKVLADTIGKIAVYCLFHRSGCTWQGQLADCTTHCSGCPFGDSSVMCNRCSVKIVHRQVEEHAQKCPAVQVQAPQADNGQVASSNQNQTVPPASASASQVQIASVASGVVQQSAQQVNPVAPPQSAQPAMPNTEQWYQQQQQYQQYYQQYAGYDPYQQQQYQQSYPYQQPVPGQQQPHLQTQFQQAPASHTSQQPQQLPQAPPAAQPQPRPPQATPIQQQIQPAGQPQTLQNQVAYSMPQSQAQTYSQVQPYAHPQTGTNVVPQQGMQMNQYQQTRPQMQPQQGMQMPQYPHSQAQHYSHPQTHMPPQTQSYPHPNSHATTTLPPPQGSQPTQPLNHAAPLQAPNASAQAVTGYQSYQQPQVQPLQQTQAGAPHTLHMNGLQQQPTNTSQLQAQFPQQPTQVRPPFVPAMVPNQQPTTVPSQVMNTGASVAQVPVYPHPKHPGYPLQHHSSMQPVQHASAHPQGFPGHGPYVQQHPVIRAPAIVQASGQAYQQNSTPAPMQPNARPMISHGGGPHPYSQAPGLTNAAHLVPMQSAVNQSYPSLPVQNMEKSKQEHTNVELGSGNLASVGTTEPKPLVGSDAKPHVSENGTPQKGNVKIKEETVDNALELPSADVGNGDFKENDQHSGKGFSTSALPPVSSVSTKQFAKEAPDSRSVPSSDLGRNQMPLVPGGPSLPQSFPEPGASQFLGQPPGQVRPQVPGKMHPSHSIYSDNSSGGVIGSSGMVPYGRGPGSMGMPQAHFNQSKFPGGPPFVSPPSGSRGGLIGGVRPDFSEGNVSKPNPPNHNEGPGGFSDGRPHELRPHGLMDQRSFGQASSFHRLQDERMNMLPGEHLKSFQTDNSFGRRDFEGELKKFPRPSHMEGGTPVNFGPRFPPPAPLDQSPHILGDRPRPAGFRDANLGRLEYPDFPRHGPGFVHHESRYPGLSGHLQRGEFDAPVNIHGTDRLIADPRQHSRAGDGNGQTMLPIHSRRGDFGSRNAHSREAAGPGSFQGHLEMGEPPFPGSYLPPRPFAEPYGREMPGYPHLGEPGFRSNFRQYGHDDRFYRGEMEPFDNPRRRRPGGMMCRICHVDCETVEGLDLHAQTREHQKKSMDMVISIKQQNSKKQKVSNQRSLFEEGRKNRTASFEGHGKKH